MNKRLVLLITFILTTMTSCSIHPSRVIIVTGGLAKGSCDLRPMHEYTLPPLPELSDDMTDIQIVDGLADHIELLRRDLNEMRKLCDY